MTVMLHPTRDKPERYRVLDKEFGIQEYFSFSKYGRSQAEKLAKELQKEIDRRKHMRALQAQLGINRLFTEDGKIRGLKRKSRKRAQRKEYEFLSLQVTVAPKTQRSKEISLMNRSFDEAYELVKQALLEFHNIKSTFEINRKFRAAKRFYW